MNNLFVHRSHPRPQQGLATISPAIIDDKEQTPMCGLWRWRIPKLRILPAVRSLFFRLRGRTPVTQLKPSENDSVSTGQRSLTRGSNRVEPLTTIAFSTSNSGCVRPTKGNQQGSPVVSSSSMSGIRDISTPSHFSLPGAVGESEVFVTTGSDILQPMSESISQTSDCDKSSVQAELTKTIFFHRPKYTCQSDSDQLIYQHVGQSLDNDKAALGAVSDAKLKETDYVSNPNTDNDRDITNGEDMDTSLEENVQQHPVDILVITHSPTSSTDSETGSDIDINIQDYEPECNVSVVSEARPISRMGRECWVEQQQCSPEECLAVEECEATSPSVDFNKPDDTSQEESLWLKGDEMPLENDFDHEEELDYYEDNNEEGDDDLDMDKVLRNCPPTEVLQNLRDMVQLSKNTTNQLEKALRQAARISSGPFPRLSGSGLTKTEVINLKCAKLVGETEDFLGDMNKNFLTFYTVLEQMDKVSAHQDSFVSSILLKRGPRDWRRGHAAIVRKMDKLWSTDYTKVITRKLKGSIQETIYEVDGE